MGERLSTQSNNETGGEMKESSPASTQKKISAANDFAGAREEAQPIQAADSKESWNAYSAITPKGIVVYAKNMDELRRKMLEEGDGGSAGMMNPKQKAS